MGGDNKQKGTSGTTKRFVVSDDLYFKIRFFLSYCAYDWQPFYFEEDYGEIGNGLVRGDRYSTTQLTDGWVYIFRKEGTATVLHSTYQVSEGNYTPVSVTPADMSHTKKLGPSGEWMIIKKYFNDIGIGQLYRYYVVASNVKLSRQRIFDDPEFSLQKDPSKRGVSLTVPRSKLTADNQEIRTGPDIYADFQKVKSKGVVLDTYDILIDDIKFDNKINLLIPDIKAETERRSALYRERNNSYRSWLTGEARTQEEFIVQAVSSIIRQKPERSKHINHAALDKVKRLHSYAYRKNFFPVHYAVNDLVEWLRGNEFCELLRDYSLGTDADQSEGLKLYHDAIKDIHMTEQGALFLGKEYDGKDSFLSRSLQLLELKNSYEAPGGLSNGFASIRKWDNIAYAIIEELLPVIAAREGLTAFLTMICNLVRQKTGIVVDKMRVRPVPWVSQEIEVIDVAKFLGKASKITETPVGKGIVSLIEGANVVLGIVGVCYSSDNEQKVKNAISLFGSIIDFGTNCWLVKNVMEKFLTKKKIVALQAISGIIDCVYGIWQAKDEWKSGDGDAAFGWSLFAIGGAIMAAGYFIRYNGLRTIAASGGAAVKPGAVMIVAGCLVEGIGLVVALYCDNNEVEDWLTQCLVGTSPQGKSLKQQIQELNDILCKFEIDARFEDQAYKFNNETSVTLEIKPRVITDKSKIIFTNMRALAHGRLMEYLNPFSNRHDLVEGMAGSENPVLDLSNPFNCTITRKNGRIEKIETTLSYPIDIDEVSGIAKLELNNGTLQGYTLPFKVKA